jgi:Zn-dependent M28 family amino/carboxypeptidase
MKESGMLKKRVTFVLAIIISLTNLLSGQVLVRVRPAEKESNFSSRESQPSLNFTQQASPTNGANVTSIDQILDKYVQAIGGVAAIKAITSRVMRGTITAPAYKITGTVEVYAKAPNKLLTEIKAPILGTTRTGFDGAVAWEEESGEVKEVPGFTKRDADFYLPLKIRDLYPKMEFKGTEKVGTTEAYRLDAPRGGNPKRWYFAAGTGLLIHTEVRDGQGKLVSSEDFEDYRPVDGIKIPFTTHQLDDGLETVTNLTEVRHNVPIDDAKFRRPAAKKASVVLSPAEQMAAAQLNADTIREVTTTLASREMEGRGMAQPGGERAAKFLAEKFTNLGLKPGGDASTYLQRMKIRIQTPQPDTSFKVGDKVFKFKTDFGIAQPTPMSDAMGASGDLVFVGYAVVSDELKRDDLAGVDVKGKIVMVLSGAPKNVEAVVWEREAAQRVVYGRLIQKGAIGFVVTYEGDMSHFPTAAAAISNRNVTPADPMTKPTTPAARWSIELLADEFHVPPSVLISESAAERILDAKGMSFTKLKQKAEAGDLVSRDLKVQASILPRFKHEEGTSSNVIGVIEGSDAKLNEEAVVFTAHYDAFGIDTEGTIYPGAADNALGVGKLVAIAEVLAKMNPKPRRSIIFIATTGEEYGDLGAEYWLNHSKWPTTKLAADINYDGSILEVWGKLGFLLDFGFSYSELDEVVKGVAVASNIEIVPDPLPEEGFFLRSDHYTFVKRGIPALFLSGGPAQDPQSLIERAQKWQATSYHMPTDTVQPDWNWEGARMAATLGLIIGMRIANQEAMPAWKPDSPYNHPRGTNPR